MRVHAGPHRSARHPSAGTCSFEADHVEPARHQLGGEPVDIPPVLAAAGGAADDGNGPDVSAAAPSSSAILLSPCQLRARSPAGQRP